MQQVSEQNKMWRKKKKEDRETDGEGNGKIKDKYKYKEDKTYEKKVHIPVSPDIT
jgi:hypothetical protein